MAAQITTFTALGATNLVVLTPGQSLTYSSVGTAFVGTVKFQRTHTAGATWDTLQTGVNSDISGLVRNDSGSDERYRFLVSSFTSGEAVCTITDTDDVVLDFRRPDGTVYMAVRDSGVDIYGDLVADDIDESMGTVGSVVIVTNGVGNPYAITTGQSSNTFTNEGASAEVYLTLPPAAPGLFYEFVVQDVNGLRVNAGSGDTIRVGGSVSATAGYIRAETIGAAVILKAINATEWVASTLTSEWLIDE